MNNLTSLFNKVYIHPLLWMMVGVAIMTARFMEVLTLFVIIFIHEMGHGIMAHFFSWRVKRIAILPFGGVAEVDEHGNRPLKEELLVTIAGPLQHVWMAALVYFLMKSGLLSQDYYDLFMNFNMMVFLFNLLPIWPLDGGKLVHLLVSSYMPFLRAIQFSLISSFVISFALSLLHTPDQSFKFECMDCCMLLISLTVAGTKTKALRVYAFSNGTLLWEENNL